MNHLRWIITGIVLLMATSSATGGEYYQFTDQNGSIVFTDDASKIPTDNPSGMKTYKSVISKPQPSTSGAASVESTISPAPLETPPAENKITDETESEEQTETSLDSDEETSEMEETLTPGGDTTDPLTPDEQTIPGVEEEEFVTPETSDEAPETSDYQTMTDQFDREKERLNQQLIELQAEKKRTGNKDIKKMTSAQLNAYEEKVKKLDSRIQKHKREENQFKERVRQFNGRISRNRIEQTEKIKKTKENKEISGVPLTSLEGRDYNKAGFNFS